MSVVSEDIDRKNQGGRAGHDGRIKRAVWEEDEMMN